MTFFVISVSVVIAVVVVFIKMWPDGIDREELRLMEEERLRRSACERLRLPKIKPGAIQDIELQYLPNDCDNRFDSNIERWTGYYLQSSWGFYGTGPTLMSQDILYQFTLDDEFAADRDLANILLDKIVSKLPQDATKIPASDILNVIKPLKEIFDERRAMRIANVQRDWLLRENAYQQEQQRIEREKKILAEIAIA